ncbi:hypothetical protein F5884DRAFT_751262 [Xylogone sp. PMI_703]|nr:hypothetical protein F5884DRAFT_751262 [Xylogone sp. PMI_703]
MDSPVPPAETRERSPTSPSGPVPVQSLSPSPPSASTPAPSQPTPPASSTTSTVKQERSPSVVPISIPQPPVSHVRPSTPPSTPTPSLDVQFLCSQAPVGSYNPPQPIQSQCSCPQCVPPPPGYQVAVAQYPTPQYYYSQTPTSQNPGPRPGPQNSGVPGPETYASQPSGGSRYFQQYLQQLIETEPVRSNAPGTTRDQRLQIKTLLMAQIPHKRISELLGVTIPQIIYAARSPLDPAKKGPRKGRKRGGGAAPPP